MTASVGVASHCTALHCFLLRCRCDCSRALPLSSSRAGRLSLVGSRAQQSLVCALRHCLLLHGRSEVESSMAGDALDLADVDSLVVGTLHSLDSSSPPAPTATAASAAALLSPGRPPSATRSAAVDSLNGRQLRVECLQRLLPGLQRCGLLSAWQCALLQSAVSSFSPRYLTVVDVWLQAERDYQLSLRAAVRTANTAEAASPAAASASDCALPARPTSLRSPPSADSAVSPNSGSDSGSGGSDGRPSPLPLLSLLSSGAAPSSFSAARVLSHLLTTALVGSLEEAWLACFMSVPTAAAKRVSKAERQRLELSGSSELVYGEVTFASLARIVWSLRSLPHDRRPLRRSRQRGGQSSHWRTAAARLGRGERHRAVGRTVQSERAGEGQSGSETGRRADWVEWPYCTTTACNSNSRHSGGIARRTTAAAMAHSAAV